MHAKQARTSGSESWDGCGKSVCCRLSHRAPLKTQEADSASDPLFILNRIVDGIFIIDLVAQFFLIYAEHDRLRGTRWVEDQPTIVKHYLCGWFTLDVCSIAISAFDIIPLCVDGADSLSKLKAFRMMRLLRLIKLVRLLKGSLLIRNMETHLAVNYAALDLISCLALLVICAHWSACLWALQATDLFTDDVLETWLGRNQYCVAVNGSEYAASPSRWPQAYTLDGQPDYACTSYTATYCAALYWSVLIVTNTGYHDLQNVIGASREQVVSMLVILISQMLWGYAFATGCAVVLQSDPEKMAMRQKLSYLNRMMAHRLPRATQVRLREYFHPILGIFYPILGIHLIRGRCACASTSTRASISRGPRRIRP